MSFAFFVTGTDTEIGKTTIAAALLYAAKQQDLSTAACKPVASGSAPSPEGLRNDDALALLAQCTKTLCYDEVNPVALAPAIAPHIAAQQADVDLSVSRLLPAIQNILARRADLTIVEGAGGWMVPLTEQERLSDLAQQLNLPVILVVGIRLGCINHALLTVESIQQHGLALAGWVANYLAPENKVSQQNVQYLTTHIAAPCLGVVPYLDLARPEQVAPYLSLQSLLSTTSS